MGSKCGCRLQKENLEESRNSWKCGGFGITYSDIKTQRRALLKLFSCGPVKQQIATGFEKVEV